MKQSKANKTRIILTRAFGLLAIPVALNSVVGMTNVAATAEFGGDAAMNPARAEMSAVERLFRSDWGTANPDVYARIALAFNTEAMVGAELRGVECRSTLCRVEYEAAPEMPVKHILPRQLAESFHSVVTVHTGRANDKQTLVYIDVPSNT